MSRLIVVRLAIRRSHADFFNKIGAFGSGVGFEQLPKIAEKQTLIEGRNLRGRWLTADAKLLSG